MKALSLPIKSSFLCLLASGFILGLLAQNTTAYPLDSSLAQPQQAMDYFPQSTKNQLNTLKTDWQTVTLFPQTTQALPGYFVIEVGDFREIAHRKSVINSDRSNTYTAQEPAAWIMMCVGLLGLILVRRKKQS